MNIVTVPSIRCQLMYRTLRMHKRCFSQLYSNLPDTEEELYKPSNKPVAHVSEYTPWGVKCFELTQQHFPNAWGFMWAVNTTRLSSTLVSRTLPERESLYQQLASKDFTRLKDTLDEQERMEITTDGLLPLGGEKGKALISEAFQYLGVPTLISCKSDLAFLNLKNKVPLEWIVHKAPAVFNIHPAPPEKPGAGVYIPSLIAEEKYYAVTVHIVTKALDSGPIMFVRRFPIPEGATRTRLYHFTAVNALHPLEELLLQVKFTNSVEEIPTTCHISWGGREITRRDLRRMEKELVRMYGAGRHPALR